MNLYEKLKAIGEGNFKVGWFRGWMGIDKEDESYAVTWTSHKDAHFPLSTLWTPPALIIDVYSSKIGNVYATALSLWIVHTEEERKEHIGTMTERIDRVYKKNVGVFNG